MDRMGLISDYDIRIVHCGFIIKFLSSTLSKGTQTFDFFKISWLNCEQYRKNQYKKKEPNQDSSVFKVLIR